MSNQLNARDQVVQRVKQHLGTDADDGQRSGSILYNGWRTLCPGKVYLMGFNPGGHPGRIQRSILESLFDTNLQDCAYSDYKEQWVWGRKLMEAGKHPHQRRVIELVQCLSIESIADVFAANAIFVRSPGQDSLERAEDLWKKCWPIHQLFLSIVRPKIILCLGNSDRLSAFKLLHDTVQLAPVERLGEGRPHVVKWFTSDIDLDSYGSLPCCLVVGVPHPSRFGVSPNIKEFLLARASFLATSN